MSPHRLPLAASIGLAFILLGAGCSNTTPAAQPTSTAEAPALQPGYTAYKNEKSGFSLQYPSDWTKTESSDPNNASVQVLSPLENNKDNFRENLNVVVNDTPDSVDVAEASTALEVMTESALTELKNNLTNFKLVADEKEEIPGVPTRSLVYSGQVASAPGLTLKFRQTYVIGPDHIYVLTFTGTEEGYGRFEKAAKTITSSFRGK